MTKKWPMPKNGARKCGMRNSSRDLDERPRIPGLRRESQRHTAFAGCGQFPNVRHSSTLKSGVTAPAMGGAPSACKSVSRTRYCRFRDLQSQARHKSVSPKETRASRNVAPPQYKASQLCQSRGVIFGASGFGSIPETTNCLVDSEGADIFIGNGSCWNRL
jgi:hypothetical protein